MAGDICHGSLLYPKLEVMFRIIILSLLLCMALSGCSKQEGNDAPPRVKWISKIVEYRPAPGQFINTSTGDVAAAQSIVGKRGLVSLGAYGGSITFCFDHSVVNKGGVDFAILGNSFVNNSEPGIVLVSRDDNSNGLADDQWYELRGSRYGVATKGYRVTYLRPAVTTSASDVAWSDNIGSSGVIRAIEFHKQCYYPLFVDQTASQITFEGSLLPNPAALNGEIWSTEAFESGYADNYSSDYDQIVDGDTDTKGSNKFDLTDAVDSSGNSVTLESVDFIRVYTCVQEQAGWIGESSTEVCGAISFSAGN